MSRRNSRSNPIENDTLAELENFKRKFLLMNKHITKMNSGLNTKVEELNTQLSQLYVENLRLRALNLSLNGQLKREREKSQRVLLEAETAATHFMKHMTTLRKVYDMPRAPTQSHQERRPQARRPTTPPPARISRAPDFHQIREVDSSEEDDRTIALANGRPHSALSMHSRLPVPTHESLAIVDAPDPWHKKTSRRKSGFLEGLQRPPSPSPGSPVTAHIKAISARLADEGDLDTEAEDLNAVQDNLPELSLPMVNFRLSRETAKPPVSLPVPGPEELNVESNSKSKPKTTKKATGLRRVGLLKDMTNTNNLPAPLEHAYTAPALADYTKPSEMPSNENAHTHADTPALPAQSLPPMHSAAHSFPALSHYSMDDNMSDDYSATGRERRSRKSVNYAEPSLKVKMRKPDGVSGSKPKRKKSSMSRTLDDDGTDGDAGAEGDAENDHSAAARLNGTGVRRRSVAVASATLKPIEESRRHSIAA